MAITPFYNKDITLFAETNFRNQRKPFGIKRADMEKHMYVLGKTGTGKTSMLAHMIVQDMFAGRGVILIDVTGGLSDQMLHYVPESRLKDTVYWDPTDRDYQFVFNCLDDLGAENERYTVVSGLVNFFRGFWRDVWGARLEYVLSNAILTLLYNKEMTLLHIIPLLTDPKFRAEAIEHVTDPVLSRFWTHEFGKDGEGFLRSAIEPIRDKIGQLASNQILRNTIGFPRSRFNFDDLLNKKKIVICSFNKHEIGADTAKFLGSTFLLRLLMRASERNEAREVYFYIDEFHELAFPWLEEFIGKSAHGIRFVLSHQYLSQISDNMRDVIFGNVGTIIAFRVGSSDAKSMSDEFGPTVSEHNLTTLPPYTIILKLLIDGKVSPPFSAVTLPPLPKVGLKERIIKESRAMYGEPRKEIEAKIAKSLGIPEISRTVQEEIQTNNAVSSEKSLVKEFREKIAAITHISANLRKESDYKRSVKKSEKLFQALAPGKEIKF